MRLMRRMAIILGDLKTWIYRNNTFSLCSTFNPYRYSGTSEAFFKNSDHMKLVITSAVAWAHSAEAIDLTDYKTLYFYGYHTGASTMRVDIKSKYNTVTSTAYADIAGGSPALRSIDVSSYNGSYYVRFGNTINAAATDSVYCYQIYLTK